MRKCQTIENVYCWQEGERMLVPLIFQVRVNDCSDVVQKQSYCSMMKKTTISWYIKKKG